MTAVRIYVVTKRVDTEFSARLIEATSSAQAIRHVTQPYQATVASQADLVRLVSAGTKVEKAKEVE